MLPVPILAQVPTVPPQQVVQAQQRQEFEGGLVIEYTGTNDVDFVNNLVRFTGEVKATYDQTSITAQSFSLDTKAKKGTAEGGVRVVDPEGEITASRMDFDWGAKTGIATDVAIVAGNMRLWANQLEVTPTNWVLTGVRATLSRRKNPEYLFRSPRVSIRPGRDAVAEKVSAEIFGLRLGDIPRVPWSLDPRVGGLRPPGITNKKGQGVGIRWDSSLLLNDATAVRAFVGSFPKQPPGYGLQVSYSPLNPDQARGYIQPGGDLGERFSNGWFDTIETPSPNQELDSIRRSRANYALGTFWNESPTARPDEPTQIAKAFEAVGEFGGERDGFGGLLNARVQRIRGGSGLDFVDRALVQGTLTAPDTTLGRGLDLRVRLDAFSTLSTDTEYGWVRGMVGLLYRPTRTLSFGLAYSHTSEFGSPDFDFDRPLVDRVWHVRGDFLSGPYTLRYLAKYDVGSQRWYDHEYEIALVAASLEPFIVFREVPSDYRLGLRFRLDPVIERLQQRRQGRELERKR